MKTKYKHIEFQDLTAQYPRRKTSTYNCWNHIVLLGCVEWKSSWRQYIFEPNQAEKLVFAASCLDDISRFIKQLMNKRAADKRRANVTATDMKEILKQTEKTNEKET